MFSPGPPLPLNFGAANVQPSSALKRKRESLIPPARVISPRPKSGSSNGIREIAKLPAVAIYYGESGNKLPGRAALKAARLTDAGDVLMLSDEKLTLTLNAFDQTRSISTDVNTSETRFHDLERQFSISSNAGYDRELVSCSGSGDMYIIATEVDGRTSTSRQRITLNSDQERISCVQHAGDLYVVGTSFGDVYIIRREGRSLFADRLQKQQSVLFGLVKTGAKILGLTGDAPGRTQSQAVGILKILPVPGNRYLLSVGRNVLTLWSGFAVANGEQLVWEANLKELVSQSMPSSSTNNGNGVNGDSSNPAKISLIDAALMPVESSDTVGTLIVLSSHSSESVPVGEEQQQQQQQTSTALWLHVIEFDFTDAVKLTRGNLPKPPTSIWIRSRALLTESLSEMTRPNTRPKIHTIPQLPCWRVLVSWFDGASGTMKTCQLDVKFLPVIGGGGVAYRKEDAEEQEDLDRGAAIESDDTRVQSEDFLSCAVVTGIEGVCLLLKDGSVLLSVPPPPHKVSRNRLAINAGLSARSSTTVSSEASIAEAVQLLSAICYGDVDSTSDSTSLLKLKVLFANMKSEDLSEAVMRVSAAIVNRSSTGQHWGLGETASGAGADSMRGGAGVDQEIQSSRAQYQLAHRLASDKADLHTHLVDLVMETGIMAAMLPQQEDTLLRNHQLVLGCGGLSGAIREAQQRVSDSAQVSEKSFMDQARDNAAAAIASAVSAYGTGSSAMSLGVGGLRGAAGGVAGVGGDKSSRNIRFLHAASREALRILSRGIEKAVKESLLSGRTGSELKLQGLSAADAFFSASTCLPDGFMHIAKTLRDACDELNARGTLLPAAYGVASCLFSAIQKSQARDSESVSETVISGSFGFDRPASALICHPKVRRALVDVLGVVRDACEFIRVRSGLDDHASDRSVAANGASLSALFEFSGFLRSQEGRRLKSLCAAVLKGYSLEAAGVNDGSQNIRDGVAAAVAAGMAASDVPEIGQGEALPDNWRADFQVAKKTCIGSLLSLGYTSAAFELSSRFLFFDGLLEAVDLEEPENKSWVLEAGRVSTTVSAIGAAGLRKRLRDVLKFFSSSFGTAALPLASHCMQWLEAKGKPAAVLEIGKLAPDYLAVFLKDRPHLAWMHHIGSRNYSAATQTAVDHAADETRTAATNTLLSIAKLSASLHTRSFSRVAAATTVTTATTHAAAAAVDAKAFNAAAREAEANLATLKAQEVVDKTDPSALKDSGIVPGDRAPPHLIIDKLIRLAEVQVMSATPYPVGESSSADSSALSAEIQGALQLLGTAIGQLSIRKDMLETRALIEAESQGDGQADINAADIREDLRFESEEIRRQLTDLWGTALKVQQSLWVNLAAKSLSFAAGDEGAGTSGDAADAEGLGAFTALSEEDEAQMASTVFSTLVQECRSSAAKRLLREDLLPVLVPPKARGSRDGHGDADWVVVDSATGDDDLEVADAPADCDIVEVIALSGVVEVATELMAYAPATAVSAGQEDVSAAASAALRDRLVHLIKVSLLSSRN